MQDIEAQREVCPSCAFWDGWPSERALHRYPVHRVRARVRRSNLPHLGNPEQTLLFEVCAACTALLGPDTQRLVRAYLSDPGAEVLA